MYIREMKFNVFEDYALKELINPEFEEEIKGLLVQIISDKIMVGWEQKAVDRLTELGEHDILNNWFMPYLNEQIVIAG